MFPKAKEVAYSSKTLLSIYRVWHLMPYESTFQFRFSGDTNINWKEEVLSFNIVLIVQWILTVPYCVILWYEWNK